MNSKMTKILRDAGAIKKVSIVAEGAKIHIVLTAQTVIQRWPQQIKVPSRLGHLLTQLANGFAVTV